MADFYPGPSPSRGEVFEKPTDGHMSTKCRGDEDSASLVQPDCWDPISLLGRRPKTTAADREVENTAKPSVLVVRGVDVKGDLPFLGHGWEGGQKCILFDLMLSLEKVGSGPLHQRSLLLCLSQSKEEEEKTRKPRDEKEQHLGFLQS